MHALPADRLAAWYAAIATRTSTRTFSGEPIDDADLAALESLARDLSGSAGARATIVRSLPDGLFTGVAGAYGKVVGSTAAIALVAPAAAMAEAGYIGEALVLEAESRAVASCWNAGMYDRKLAARVAPLSEGERLHSLVALGRSGGRRLADHAIRAFVSAAKRRDAEVIAPGSASWPAWAREATEAVRLAPSGGNAQPWALRMDGDALVLGLSGERTYWTREIDLGIAWLHAEVGAAYAGVTLRAERLAPPDIVRLVPT